METNTPISTGSRAQTKKLAPAFNSRGVTACETMTTAALIASAASTVRDFLRMDGKSRTAIRTGDSEPATSLPPAKKSSSRSGM